VENQILAVETRHLSRSYGKVNAVEDLNLSISQGSLFGLIGPNGAGKTTTLRMLAGLLAPSSGEIWIAGELVRKDGGALQRRIGYMPDFYGVYEVLVVWEYLDFFARCHGLAADRRKQVVGELLELVDLGDKRDAFVQTLSRGMRQRLCLAHALVHEPDVLLLDEPASGLDPRARVEMRELLRELGAMGKTIVLSSHILVELAELCDSIAIIEKGKVVTSGLLTDIRSRAQAVKRIRMRPLAAVAEAQRALSAYAGVGPLALPGEGDPAGALEFDFSGDDEAAASLLEYLISEKIRPVSFEEVHTGLEELFLQLTKGEVA
jgi:ABC-2 type transport system ATP-binding protein